jgi:DNA-binding LacI/PurR family transcriptional regulator
MKIDRQSREPLYRQIQAILLKEIQNKYIPGDMLPSENSLCTRFGVERNTVRKALDVLLGDGLIKKIQGRGTEIIARKPAPKTVVNRLADMKKENSNRNILYVTYGNYLQSEKGEYHLSLIQGFEKKLSLLNYHLLIKSVDDNQNFSAIIKDTNPVAIIFDSRIPPCHYEEALQFPLPCVSINHYTELITSIVNNNFDSGFQVAHLLTKMGHRKIMFITGKSGYQSSSERLSGVQAYFREAGFAWNEKYVFNGDWSFNSGIEAGKHVFSLDSTNRPTAVFAFNDDMAFGCYSYLEKKGVSVPVDLSLVGFDRSEHYPSIFRPITTVDVNISTIINYTCWYLLSQLEGTAPEQPVKIQIATTIEDNGTIMNING